RTRCPHRQPHQFREALVTTPSLVDSVLELLLIHIRTALDIEFRCLLFKFFKSSVRGLLLVGKNQVTISRLVTALPTIPSKSIDICGLTVLKDAQAWDIHLTALRPSLIVHSDLWHQNLLVLLTPLQVSMVANINVVLSNCTNPGLTLVTSPEWTRGSGAVPFNMGSLFNFFLTSSAKIKQLRLASSVSSSWR